MCVCVFDLNDVRPALLLIGWLLFWPIKKQSHRRLTMCVYYLINRSFTIHIAPINGIFDTYTKKMLDSNSLFQPFGMARLYCLAFYSMLCSHTHTHTQKF